MNPLLNDTEIDPPFSMVRSRGMTRLLEAGVSNARMEGQWILEEALKRSSDNLQARDLFDRMIADRCRRIPLAYVLGTQPFLHLELHVNPGVLIPRAETEMLAQTAAEVLKSRRGAKLLDVGTGSGCIAVALAALYPDIEITALDVSRDALLTAQKNAMLSGVGGRIRFLSSRLFENLRRGEVFDAIASNPPYVKTAELRELEPEIQYEPRLALDGGSDGLEVIRPLVSGSVAHLKSGGALVLEVGYDQSHSVSELMASAGYKNIRTFQDSQGIARIVMGTYFHG